MVGEPEALPRVLTDDAEGWSPTLAYCTRAEAQTQLLQEPWPLLVVQFRVTSLIWSPPLLFAEWHLDAIQSGPMLVADDILIEATHGTIALAGASVARMRGDRICAIHTYFDDADLIEQLLVDTRDHRRRDTGLEP